MREKGVNTTREGPRGQNRGRLYKPPKEREQVEPRCARVS